MNKNVALITGSYGGLGKCLAEIHAKKGGNLILVGRNQKKLDEQSTELSKKYNVSISTISVDLSKDDSAEYVYNICKEKNWSVDYLINNAGFGGQGDFARERSMDDDVSMINVNIMTLTKICKLFIPDFISRGSGKVLNVSSTAATMPGPLQAVYYATKAYVTSLSNSLWRELKDTNVTVTSLMPGAMKTGFANTGGLSDTKLFANAVDPYKVALDGYKGMIKGKLNVISGLPGWQRGFMKLAPLFPKKMMLSFVYKQQIRGSAKKRG